jgi:hypothetical protein
MVTENILAQVGGEHVAAALNTLPDRAVDTEERRETVIDVPQLGQVRFTCKRFVSRKGKLRNAFWVAEKAELVVHRIPPVV